MEKVKLKGSSTRENAHLRFERDHYAAYGFSWPQRNYKCTFCTKEFKSAQALGGHMNVHRRDRARLRQSSPSSWDLHSPNPNPNFSSNNSSSLSSSSTAVRFVPYPTNLIYQHSLISSSSRDEERVPLIAQHSGRDFVGPQLGDIRKKLGMEMGIMGSNDVQENGVWKKRDEIIMMGMELELGLVRDAKVVGLDLELRLGQSNLM